MRSRRKASTTAPTRKTSIILDFGGVLGLPHDPAREKVMASLCGLSLPDFLCAYKRDRRELDMGTMPTTEYWRRMLSFGGVKATADLLAQLEREDTLAWTRINHTVVQWAAELRKTGYSTSILSNMPRETAAYMREHPDFHWFGDFTAIVFSCEKGAAKPDPPIYLKCLEELRVDINECLFLDDSVENIEGARAVGLTAELFRPSVESALALKSRWQLPVATFLNESRRMDDSVCTPSETT